MKTVSMIIALVCVAGIGAGSVPNILGLSDVTSETAYAVRVQVPQGMALTGLRWYNNDATVVFPEIRAAAAVGEEPQAGAQGVLAAVQVSGGSLAWSEVGFGFGIVSSTEALDVRMLVPELSAYVHDGAGGGAGLGYICGEGGRESWLSHDGNAWFRLHEDYSFALEPVFSPSTPADVVAGVDDKSLVEGSVSATAPDMFRTVLSVAPNPFNPMTQVRFHLESACRVELNVVDLKGAVVRRLAAGVYSGGGHVVDWDGRSDHGNEVASGRYLATLRVGGNVHAADMTLVR